MKPDRRPAFRPATLAALGVVVLWGVLRLGIFGDEVFPLTYVLPLLLCMWTRRRWHLWTMTVIFIGMALYKFYRVPGDPLSIAPTQVNVLAATLLNTLLGSVIVTVGLALRDRLDRRTDEVQQQNHELEAQSEELAQQNEEIRAQSEELAQQSEEIEAQAEELAQQNEELQYHNVALSGREEVLQAILLSSRSDSDRMDTLTEVCRRILPSIGRPAESMAVLELAGNNTFQVAAQVSLEASPGAVWPDAESLAVLVLKEQRTAYVDDFLAPSDPPLFTGSPPACRSALMTPLLTGGVPAGVLAVSSSVPGHWTEEQFRLLEWAAAQCGLLLESVRSRRDLQERTEALEAAHQAKDDFLASLSHELRTPLTPVMAVVGLLETDRRLPDDVVADLRMIQRNIGVQSRLIDDLLDLTRIAKGKIDLNLQLVCVATLLKECAEIMSSTLVGAGLTLDLRIDLPEAVRVHGDGARLQQVFWNILSNSVKFSPGKGVITVGARLHEESGNGIELTFTDEGPGISEADIERIFMPFEQAATLRNRTRHQGLGLGLSIARAIAELHRGRIQAWPAGPQGGGRFTVHLPLATPFPVAPPDKITAIPPPPPIPMRSALRILLVEDHEDTGRTLCRLLARRGYEAIHARSCGEALELFGERKFDFLLSDLGLPDGTGVDLMIRLQQLSPGLPGVCMSGYGMESDVARTREAGFQLHLIKPVRVQALEEAILSIAHHIHN